MFHLNHPPTLLPLAHRPQKRWPKAKSLATLKTGAGLWEIPLGNSGLVGLVIIFGYLWHKGTLLESFGGKNVLAPWCLDYSS